MKQIFCALIFLFPTDINAMKRMPLATRADPELARQLYTPCEGGKSYLHVICSDADRKTVVEDCGDARSAALLLLNGANPMRLDDTGTSAFGYAGTLRISRPRVFQVLNAGLDVWTILLNAPQDPAKKFKYYSHPAINEKHLSAFYVLQYYLNDQDAADLA